MLKIVNDGQDIKSTNYWDSDLAKNDLCYLTWNAGAGRLLLPEMLVSSLKDMASAEYVIVSRGPWPLKNNADSLELLFEDHSKSPYCIHITAEQTDRIPEPGEDFVIAIWTSAGKQSTLPGKFRRVTEIPCLLPWGE